MKTNYELGISEETEITLPYVINIIKELCPEGSTYANVVMELAVGLGDVLGRFYNGAFLSDFGRYPFLIVKEYHYEENGYISDPVIVKSEFDLGSFNEFVDCLSLSDKIKDELKKEGRLYCAKTDEAIDYCYLKVITSLIQKFKQLEIHHEIAQATIEKFDLVPVGYSFPVKLGKVLTLSYLMKRMSKYNRKKGAVSGKYLLVLKDSSSDGYVIVSCEKYNKK